MHSRWRASNFTQPCNNLEVWFPIHHSWAPQQLSRPSMVSCHLSCSKAFLGPLLTM